MLFKTPSLEAVDHKVVDKISTVRESLRHTLGTPRRWTGLLRRSTLGRAMRGSNSIEGYRIDKQDVVSAAQGEPVKADDETAKAIEGYRRAMTYVLNLARDPHFTWSVPTIKGLHFMMLEHDPDKSPGMWRLGPIYVHDEEKKEVVYEGPDFSLVPSLMEELVATLAAPDEKVPYLVRASMAHLNLTMIHPFRDGNGRMARCLQSLVLGRGFALEPPFSSIEEFLGRHQYPYYDSLAAVGRGSWHPENDALHFVRFCLRAHFYQAHTLLQRSRESEQMWTALLEEATKRDLHERTVFALWDAAHGYKVVNATYRDAADLNQPVASRELTAMVDAGLLVAEGEKRARSYTAAPVLVELRKKIRGGRAVIPDPYREVPRPVLSTATAPAGTFTVPLNPPSSTGSKLPSVQSPHDTQG